MSAAAAELVAGVTLAGDEPIEHPALRRTGRILGSLAIGLIATTAVWVLFVTVVKTEALVTKSPLTVWRCLTSDAKAASHRSVIYRQLGTRWRHA